MASSSSLTLLASDLQQLAGETKRKYGDIKEAAERALSIIKSNPDQVVAALRADVLPPTSQVDEVLKPFIAGCGTKNVKVVAIALASLQRLIGMGAIPRTKIPQVVSILSTVSSLGVEIQLRILQTLPSLLMRFPLQLHADLLSELLFLCFRLQDSRVGVVSSTAAATLRQLVMLVFDGVVEEDRAVHEAKDSGKPLDRRREETEFVVNVPAVHPPVSPVGQGEGSGEKRVHLRPSAKDAYLLFEDLCLLVNGEPGTFLKLQTLSKTFGLELIESVMTGHGKLFQKHPELVFVLRAHLCPFLIRALSDKPTFALTLRLTRIAFLLLKQFADDLYAESEVFLTILIRMVSASLDADVFSSPTAENPPWLRILAMEIFRGLCADFDLLIRIYDRYDARSRDREARLFTNMMGAFNRLASEKPQLLGVNHEINFGAPGSTGSSGSAGVQGVIDGVVGMATQAAAPLVAGQQASLSASSSQMKLQCIDQLDKAEAPAIPDTYGYLLALQCLANVSEGFANLTLGLHRDIARQRPRTSRDAPLHAPGAIDWHSLPSAPRFEPLHSVRAMADASWPALLASLTFFLSVNLEDDLFGDTIAAMQKFTNVCGVLGLDTPRDAFLSGMCKFAIPPPIVAAATTTEQLTSPAKASQSVLNVESLGLGGSSSSTASLTLGPRNFACLRALIAVAHSLAGSLQLAWYIVFEALQNMDHVLASRRKKRTVTMAASMTPAVAAEQEDAAVQASMQKLFEQSKALDDLALQHFVAALCRLSCEMVGLHDIDSSSHELSPIETPRSVNPEQRRRLSGLNASKILRQTQTSFSVSKLGSVALLNIARLVSSEPSVGWQAVTTHLLAIQRSADAPASVRLQATDVLDSIFLSASRVDAKEDQVLQHKIQTRVVEALARQAEPEMRIQTSVDVEVRKRAFETLYKILEANGHAFVAGWRLLLDILRTACPSPLAAMDLSPQKESEDSPYFPSTVGFPSKNPLLVRTAFPALHLICTDFLAVLNLDELRHCISVLTDFGGQVDDINIALTAEGLLWQVSDHVQTQKSGEDGEAYVDIWMFLLSSFLDLCRSPRQEIRDGAIQTLFRTLGLYAAALPESLWECLVEDVIFALLDHLSTAIAAALSSVSEEGATNAETTRQPNREPLPLPAKQLDDSKVLVIDSTARVFRETLAARAFRTPRLSAACTALLSRFRQSFIVDRPPVQVAAARAFRSVLQSDFGDISDGQRTGLWTDAWQAFVAMGGCLSTMNGAWPSKQYYTQASLEALVAIADPLLTSGTLDVSLDRVTGLLAIFRTSLLYAGSPDYRLDVDQPSPLQKSVLDMLSRLSLDSSGVPSAVISFFADIGALAFEGAFPASNASTAQGPRYGVTYIALCKESLPKMADIYGRFQSEMAIYINGAVARLLACYGVPLRMKYNCPPSNRHGSDPPLWKIATTYFLSVSRICMPRLAALGPHLPAVTFESVWHRLAEAVQGALLADCTRLQAFEVSKQHEDEDFDLTLLRFVETDILPYLGGPRVPDGVIKELLGAVEQASYIYHADLPEATVHDRLNLVPPLQKETHFSDHLLFGSTAAITERPRERFAYWCLDLLFILCSTQKVDGNVDSRRRVASLTRQLLIRRCRFTMDAYAADAHLRGRLPFPRVREEELVHVLRRLLELRLWPDTLLLELTAESSADTATSSALKRSPTAHLAELYASILSILASPSSRCPPNPFSSPSEMSYAPARDLFPARIREPAGRSARVGSASPLIDLIDDAGAEWDPHRLAMRCLQLLGHERGLVQAASPP